MTDHFVFQDLLMKRIIGRGHEFKSLYVLDTEVPRILVCSSSLSPFEVYSKRQGTSDTCPPPASSLSEPETSDFDLPITIRKVVCLDGDGCKLRSGSATIEANSNLDTSIACDSCDIWYHAFCVAFDPEDACENSWLCPRCMVAQSHKKSDDVLGSRANNQHAVETVSGDCSLEAAFSGKLSVSVADASETAVVVSFVKENLGKEELSGEISNLVVGEGSKIDALSPNSAAAAPK